MDVIRSLKKNFYSDQDKPPALQKLWTTIVFTFLILTETIRLQLSKLLCMQKRYLLRVSESLRIYSLDLFRNALNDQTFVDDLPALPFIRRTIEEQLAGFKHELSS